MNQPEPFVRPEATTWSVDDILRKAKEGQLYIPVFQRNFVWEAEDVRKLFDSIYRGYPIGDLLLWETEHTEGVRTDFGPLRFEPSRGRNHLIIDGQQRVTSLVAVLLARGTQASGKFSLFFDLAEGKFEYAQPRERVAESWLPLPEVADTMRFLQWLQARRLPPPLVNVANQLVRALRDYRIPVYIVHAQDEGQIREIFERLNTTGKRLEAKEVFAAIHRGRPGTDLAALGARLNALGFGAPEEEWLLKAAAAVLGIDVTRNFGEALREKPQEEVRTALDATERAIENVIAFLQEEVGIVHVKLLPYRFPLVPLTKLFHLVRRPSPATRRQLAAWFWRGAWSASHARADAPTIRAALKSVTDDESATIQQLIQSTPLPERPFDLPQRHDFREAGTKLVCAVLASRRPRHLQTGEELDVKSLLDEHGDEALVRIVRDRADSAGATENRILHNKLPQLRQAICRTAPDILESHCISAKARYALSVNRWDEFLTLRRAALEDAVRSFLQQRTA
ncbi:DUF262 domain-containing protein [Polyangium mundeleinium]|uniref:DUF262 domain-containing protein n=1 Tax=Polyangium mundeleinium TaxID=2995306 RepID=A0ABT5EQQ9_9BACT|nr:DUF262 domain-containing protein [Polyangium mundeleinium]MDC0744163.1 DUF262 domain-containing protein [Polyangium mundeleinium]